MKTKFKYLFFCIITFIPVLTKSESIVFSDLNQTMALGSSISILEDKSQKLTIKNLLNSNQFKHSKQAIPNLGVSTSCFWLKFEIKNTTTSNNLLLELAYPLIDKIEFYTINPDGSIKIEKVGEYKIFSQRNFDHPNYIFNLNIPQNESRTYFLKIRSDEQILIPLNLGSSQLITKSLMQKDTIFGLFAGIILAMFFYNLFIYLTTQDKSYLFYVIYIISVGLVQACLQGYTFKYLWPNTPWLALKSIFLLSSLIGITPILFMKVFLQTKINSPKLHHGLNVFLVIYIIYIILFSLGYTNNTYTLIQTTAIGLSLYMLFVAYKISKTGNRTAIFFLFAWSVFLIGVFIYALKDLGILPYNNLTYYTMQTGSAMETILLSFALADRINILKKEKETSQAEALRISKENEDIIKRQNIILDIKVIERTEELEKSNLELNNTLRDLKETQSKLVDSEKMASLGQLTAGIAHEINNPINFVSSSVKPLKRDISDLLTILEKYDEISMDGNVNQKISEVNVLKKELDLDYLKEEINILLNGIDDGANRTAEIVKGLRNFSRMDEDDLKTVNIHEGIDSSLVLLNSTLGKIDIIKEYGKIPSIECFAGKLNQVFMNILTNATQAINSNMEATEKGTIIIKTYEEGPNIIVSFKDSGPGMTEEVKNKVFEPFFTTKAVGEGTGLGLSIVFSIIEAHKGLIEVVSEIGKGTEFIITLPKTQKN